MTKSLLEMANQLHLFGRGEETSMEDRTWLAKLWNVRGSGSDCRCLAESTLDEMSRSIDNIRQQSQGMLYSLIRMQRSADKADGDEGAVFVRHFESVQENLRTYHLQAGAVMSEKNPVWLGTLATEGSGHRMLRMTMTECHCEACDDGNTAAFPDEETQNTLRGVMQRDRYAQLSDQYTLLDRLVARTETALSYSYVQVSKASQDAIARAIASRRLLGDSILEPSTERSRLHYQQRQYWTSGRDPLARYGNYLRYGDQAEEKMVEKNAYLPWPSINLFDAGNLCPEGDPTPDP